MYDLEHYLHDDELSAARAYANAYREEYLRVYQPAQAGDPARTRYWSDLAHRVARAAQEKVLAEQEQTWQWTPRASIAQYTYPAE